MDRRALARQDRRDRGAAVAELHLDLPPVGKQVAQESIALDLLPSQRVDEHENLYHGACNYTTSAARAPTLKKSQNEFGAFGFANGNKLLYNARMGSSASVQAAPMTAEGLK